MATEIVTVLAGGTYYRGWQKVTLNAAINEACRKFDVKTTERPGEFDFPPGTPVEIAANGDLFLVGFVNAYSASGEAKSHEISIKGRSSSQDWVDCSAIHKTGYAENKSPVQFAQEFNPYGFPLTDKLGLEPVPYQQIMQGETGFDYLERALRPHGATQMGTADGGIDVTNASVAMRAAGALEEGVNIKIWSVDLTDGSRHSEYTIKGQNRHGHGDHNLRIKQTARDGGVRRYRPKIIVHEGDCDDKRALNRANHEKERSAGACIKAQVTTQGWRDAAGALWTPNTLIFVSSPILMHLEQDMLIESVILEQDEKGSGTTAKLNLVDPRNYRGQGKSGKGSDSSWNEGIG
jgi:prophage tail gpP-like protein